MPQRRSQNLSLNDSFTFSRASERRRKSTTRAEQSKITDRAVSLDCRRRQALISSNVDELRLSSTSRQSSSSEQFSSCESQLSSLSWWFESSSLRCSWSDSSKSSLCSEYWKNELDISKDKAERSRSFSAAEVAVHAKFQKEQQNWADAAQRLKDNKVHEETLW